MRKPKTHFYIPIDLAAVCSVVFILLLLYLSMAGYKPQEPVEISLPETSGYRCSLNGLGDAIILIGNGKVFLQLSDTLKKDALLYIGKERGLEFSKANIDKFKHTDYIGEPVASYTQNAIGNTNTGFTLALNNNELAAWIRATIKAYQTVYHRNGIMISIKADKNAPYPLIKKAIATLQDQHINRMSFITATKFKTNAN